MKKAAVALLLFFTACISIFAISSTWSGHTYDGRPQDSDTLVIVGIIIFVVLIVFLCSIAIYLLTIFYKTEAEKNRYKKMRDKYKKLLEKNGIPIDETDEATAQA